MKDARAACSSENGYLVEALNNDNESELETVAEVIIRMWIVTGLQGFSGYVDDLGQAPSWRLFAQSSLDGDDEDISNIGDAGHDGKEKEKENGGYFASPSVPLYDEENVMLGMMVLMMLVMRRRRVTLKFQIQVLHSVLAPWSWWLGLVWDGVSWLFIN